MKLDTLANPYALARTYAAVWLRGGADDTVLGELAALPVVVRVATTACLTHALYDECDERPLARFLNRLVTNAERNDTRLNDAGYPRCLRSLIRRLAYVEYVKGEGSPMRLASYDETHAAKAETRGLITRLDDGRVAFTPYGRATYCSDRLDELEVAIAASPQD